MIKIIYPDGRTEYKDVRRLTNYDLYSIIGSWGTMEYLYTTYDMAGRPVDFYIVHAFEMQNPDGTPHMFNPPFNQKVFLDYGVRVYGTAIICRSDILDTEE